MLVSDFPVYRARCVLENRIPEPKPSFGARSRFLGAGSRQSRAWLPRPVGQVSFLNGVTVGKDQISSTVYNRRQASDLLYLNYATERWKCSFEHAFGGTSADESDREQLLSSQPSQKNSKTLHPDEEPKPRLPDSIARPITNMPLSRMENTPFVKPSIIDFHDMGLRTVLTVRTPKNNAYDEGERILEKAWLVSPH
ncbi:hypothetical protein TNCV_2110011 [Trichonephila clavipes]|nr:hypothetical protein TNCV_2110011 [Trichonephila clavipes]